MQLSPTQLLCVSFFWAKVGPEPVSRQLKEGKDPQACLCMLVSVARDMCCCSGLCSMERGVLFCAGLGLQVQLSCYLINSPSGNLLPDSSLQLMISLQVVYQPYFSPGSGKQFTYSFLSPQFPPRPEYLTLFPQPSAPEQTFGWVSFTLLPFVCPPICSASTLPVTPEDSLALAGKAEVSESQNHGELCGGARGLKKPPPSQLNVPTTVPSLLLYLCLSLSLEVPSHPSLPEALQGIGTC